MILEPYDMHSRCRSNIGRPISSNLFNRQLNLATWLVKFLFKAGSPLVAQVFFFSMWGTVVRVN